MSFDALTRQSLSIFEAVGGWRTVAEGVASRAVFVVAYLLTEQILASALITVGGVLIVTIARVWTDRQYWRASVGLATVVVSAITAGGTGDAVNFYLTATVTNLVAGPVVLVSMLVRWPLVGLVAGGLRGQRFGWRRDRTRLRRYQACTAILLAKFAIATAVMLPLYLGGEVAALGIASTLLGTPAAGLCVYLCWRILRTETGPAPRDSPVPATAGQSSSPREALSRSSCGTANRSP